MLLNSVNPIDYVLDIYNNKQKPDDETEDDDNIENDKNSYKNLTQEEDYESVNNSNAINFNESESTSIPTNNYIRRTNSNNQEHNQIYQPRTQYKLCNYLIDKLFLNLTKFLQFIGPLFCITIITFLLYTYFSILKNIFPYWYQNFLSYENHKIFYITHKFLISLELFLTLFNNILSIIVKPGNIPDLRNSKYYQTHNPYYSDKLKIPLCFIQNNHIDKHTTINWRKCKYCKEIKPLRTHHCSLCGTCIFKMDHHCPWVNNCIGQNNHRYFLLFLFHVFCYTVLGTIITLPILIFNKKITEKNLNKIIIKGIFNMREVKYISVLGISSLVIEIFFAGWNWFLAFNGNTTLEFWADRTDFILDGGVRNYSFGNWRKNLFYIFGTENLFKILFVPSIKKLPFSGLEFSRVVDKNFCIEGIN